MDPIEELLTRRTQDIFPTKEEFQKLLQSGKKIKLYQGFDPSSPNLHIGHLVGLLQLKMFQDLGHQVIFLIGDFTGMIGDPTDKSAARPKLTKEQVLENAETYKAQAGRILRFEGDNAALLKFNSEWLEKLNFADILELSSNLTVQQLIERDMFQDRLKNNRPIFLHEFLYPMLQGYDSVAMEVDLEIGGNDQMFNMLTGRHLMKVLKNKEKFVLTTKLLSDSQGRKIGKTTGNAINLFGHPNDLYGQLMALPDDAILPGLKLATTLPMEEVNNLESQIANNPMDIKKRLAYAVTHLCHGQDAADTAQNHFAATVQQKEIPDTIENVNINAGEYSLLNLITQSGVGESNSQIRRVIEQGGVELNNQKITDPNQTIQVKDGDIIKFGKRIFRKIITN